MFKYSTQKIDVDKLNKYCIKHVVNCEIQNSHIVLDINFSNEDGFDWIEGEGMLLDLLPLYDEIKSGNYQFLQLVANASHTNNSLKNNSGLALSKAQEAFFKYAEIDYNVFYE